MSAAPPEREYTAPPSEPALRVQALESLLSEKGLVDKAEIDAIIDLFENKVGPRNGAKVVARAWTDRAFRERLLADGAAAIASMGYSGRGHEHITVVENTDAVHHVVVCTLCSCYPWVVLGLPPAWYKSAAYRARVVAEPREVLREFGTFIAENVEILVHDATAEVRYMVLPQRPAGTDGWDEGRLAALVTRNSMVGVEQPRSPEAGG